MLRNVDKYVDLTSGRTRIKGVRVFTQDNQNLAEANFLPAVSNGPRRIMPLKDFLLYAAASDHRAFAETREHLLELLEESARFHEPHPPDINFDLADAATYLAAYGQIDLEEYGYTTPSRHSDNPALDSRSLWKRGRNEMLPRLHIVSKFSPGISVNVTSLTPGAPNHLQRICHEITLALRAAETIPGATAGALTAGAEEAGITGHFIQTLSPHHRKKIASAYVSAAEGHMPEAGHGRLTEKVERILWEINLTS